MYHRNDVVSSAHFVTFLCTQSYAKSARPICTRIRKSMSSKPIIRYWGAIRSRAFYMGVLLGATGNSDKVEFKSEGTNGNPLPFPGTPEWDQLGPKTKSPWGFLPTLTDEASGLFIGEASAIARWLIKRFDLQPEDMKLFGLSEQAIDKVNEIHDMIGGAHYSPDRTAAMDAFFAAGSRLHQVFAGLETVIEGSPWMGSAATPGDYMLAASCSMINALQGDFLDGYPKCKALMEQVMAMDGVKAYLETVPYPYFKRKSD